MILFVPLAKHPVGTGIRIASPLRGSRLKIKTILARGWFVPPREFESRFEP